MQNKIKSERIVWLDIMLTLVALEIMQFFYYGVRATALSGVCAVVSLATEIICVRLMGRHFTADDLHCLSDALIISLMLPAVTDFRIVAIACIFMAVIKNVFGGRKNMIFSPSAVAYVFMLTSWRGQLVMYTEPHTHTGIFEKAGSLVSSASHAFNTTGKMNYTDFEILMGNVTGSLSILLLIVSALILFFRNDISRGAFVGAFLGIIFLAGVLPMCNNVYNSIKYTFSTNMVLFAMIYIISDKRIAPKQNYYAFFYGFFIAILSYVLVLATTKENMIVVVSLLFTPVALAFRNLEKHIEILEKEEAEAVE